MGLARSRDRDDGHDQQRFRYLARSLYRIDAVVTLTATAAVGAIFTGWTGSITSTNNPLVLGMNGNKSIVAGFYIIPTTKLWTGGSAQSGNWTDADNWSPSVPNAGDYLIFP